MDKEDNITKIMELMHDLMHSTRIQDPHPWLHLELTREQLRVIFLVSFKDRVSPGEVASSFGVPKANVTSVIDKLVNKGLINRLENPNDRRSYILVLTSDGRSQVERLHEMGTTKIRRVLEKMTDDTLYCLNKGLAALTSVLREEGVANGCH
jgi:DNA-binding MarR family transcriptional regulator